MRTVKEQTIDLLRKLGVTTVDHYFDTLGGITRAVKRASDTMTPNAKA